MVMGQFMLSPLLETIGWLATVVMGTAAVGMAVTWRT